MGLRIKILSGFVILVLMLALAGAWSVYEIRSTGFSVEALINENFRSIHAAKDMMEALEREDSAILLLILGKWEKGRKMLSDADKAFIEKLQFAYSNVTIPGEKTYLDTISARYQTYHDLWQRPIVDTPREGNIEWYFNRVHQSFLSAKEAVQRLNDLNSDTMYRAATDLKQRANRAVMPGLIAIFSALLFALIFNYMVNFYMVSPIIRITNRIKQFIARRTPYDVKIDSHDEIAHLSESIDKLCASIEAMREE